MQCDSNGDCTCEDGFGGSKCEFECTSVGGHCYKFVPTKLTLEGAVKHCSDLGGKIFVPTDEAQNVEVYDFVKEQGGGTYFIGSYYDNNLKK